MGTEQAGAAATLPNRSLCEVQTLCICTSQHSTTGHMGVTGTEMVVSVPEELNLQFDLLYFKSEFKQPCKASSCQMGQRRAKALRASQRWEATEGLKQNTVMTTPFGYICPGCKETSRDSEEQRCRGQVVMVTMTTTRTMMTRVVAVLMGM